MHISLFWTGGPYVEAVRKAGEESPTRLICLTNTAGAATRPLPPVRSLSYLLSIPGRDRLPRSVSRRENRSTCVCAWSCGYRNGFGVTSSWPFFSFLFFGLTLTLWRTPVSCFKGERLSGLFFDTARTHPHASCLFWSCDPVISPHVCDEIGSLKTVKLLPSLQIFKVVQCKWELKRGEIHIKDKIQHIRSRQLQPAE